METPNEQRGQGEAVRADEDVAPASARPGARRPLRRTRLNLADPNPINEPTAAHLIKAQITHPRDAHMARLMPMAKIQGHGDEYRRRSEYS
jgi:hypothetical protein